MKEQLQKDFDNIIKNLSLSQRDTEIKQTIKCWFFRWRKKEK